MKSAITYIFGLLSGIVISGIAIFLYEPKKITKIHTLQQPLVVSSNHAGNLPHLLPVGTTLYLDKSFPEGFTRYKVYVNIDRMPIALQELTDPEEIDPIEARAFDKSTLMLALRGYPLSRAELAAILQSPQLTKKDVQEVLNEYLEKSE